MKRHLKNPRKCLGEPVTISYTKSGKGTLEGTTLRRTKTCWQLEERYDPNGRSALVLNLVFQYMTNAVVFKFRLSKCSSIARTMTEVAMYWKPTKDVFIDFKANYCNAEMMIIRCDDQQKPWEGVQQVRSTTCLRQNYRYDCEKIRKGETATMVREQAKMGKGNRQTITSFLVYCGFRQWYSQLITMNCHNS